MLISEFQKLMRDLYYTNDLTRGVHRTALWLGEEVGELMHVVKNEVGELDHNAIAEEMADIYAWVASLANLLAIDLEQAIAIKYPSTHCIKCGHNPCQCESH